MGMSQRKAVFRIPPGASERRLLSPFQLYKSFFKKINNVQGTHRPPMTSTAPRLRRGPVDAALLPAEALPPGLEIAVRGTHDGPKLLSAVFRGR